MRIVDTVDQPINTGRFALNVEQLDYASPRLKVALKRELKRRHFADGMYTFDQQSIDSAGAFLVNELERLDQRLHMPLAAVTWNRDIDLRSDVSVADESTSYTNTLFGSPPGVAGSNISWIGKNATAIPAMGLDIGKTSNPLTLWGQEVSFTIPELKSAEQLGRPIDAQQIEALNLKWNMDIDQMVAVGDSALNATGMFNHALLSNHSNAITGSWASATAAQILADVNDPIQSVWSSTGYALLPNRALFGPKELNIVVTTIVSSAGNISILEYLRRNNLSEAQGTELEFNGNKWLIGTNNAGQGPAATDSLFLYVKAENRVRIPVVMLQRTPPQYLGLRQTVVYFGRIGCVELVYPETAARRDNLG